MFTREELEDLRDVLDDWLEEFGHLQKQEWVIKREKLQEKIKNLLG